MLIEPKYKNLIGYFVSLKPRKLLFFKNIYKIELNKKLFYWHLNIK